MENILSNIVRVGTVSSIDTTNRKARVLYKDKNFTSDWLYILQHPGAGVHVEKNRDSDSLPGEEAIESVGEHDHDAEVTYWMPVVNDTVLVLYLPMFNGDGFILGVI